MFPARLGEMNLANRQARQMRGEFPPAGGVTFLLPKKSPKKHLNLRFKNPFADQPHDGANLLGAFVSI